MSVSEPCGVSSVRRTLSSLQEGPKKGQSSTERASGEWQGITGVVMYNNIIFKKGTHNWIHCYTVLWVT